MGNVVKIKKPEKTDDNYLTLTLSEYDDMTNAFFEVESVIRILKERCFDRGQEPDADQDYLDISNCLHLAQNRLNAIFKPLAK